MDCSGIADHLSPLFDGELESEKAEYVREHLARCPRCNKIFQAHKDVKRLLSQKLLLEKAPPRLRSALLRRLEGSPAGGFFRVLVNRLRERPLVASGMATVLLVVILASVLSIMNAPHLPPPLLELLAHYAEAQHPPLEVVSADVGHVAQKMSERLKIKVNVADLKSRWCSLMGARKCPCSGRPAVEIRYLHPAGNLSFFMLPDAGEKALAKLCKSGTLQKKRMDGGTYLCCETKCGKAILWMEGDDVFAVMSGHCLDSAVSLFDIARQIRKDCRPQRR